MVIRALGDILINGVCITISRYFQRLISSRKLMAQESKRNNNLICYWGIPRPVLWPCAAQCRQNRDNIRVVSSEYSYASFRIHVHAGEMPEKSKREKAARWPSRGTD